MGRKTATGKYNTRKELIESVLFFYYKTQQCQSQVARTTGVSEGVVAYILDNHSGEKP